MSTKKVLSIAAAVILVGITSGVAQTTSQVAGDELLRALLEEMRLLRTTIQKNSSADLRGRFLLERTRMQNEVVRELQRELEQRSMNTPMAGDEAMIDEATDNYEQRIRNESNVEQRRQLERERDQMVRRREMQKRYIEEARIRQQRLEARVAEEREKLDALEKEIQVLANEMSK
jgi:hypothetical protein